MADQNVVNYITQQRAQKTPDNVIADALLKAGYKKEDVDEGFKLLTMSSTEIPVADLKKPIVPGGASSIESHSAPQEPVSPSGRFGFLTKKMLILIGVGVVLLLVLLSSVLFLSQSSQNEPEEVVEETEEEEVIEEEPEVTPIESGPEISPTAPVSKEAKIQEDIQILVDSIEKYFGDNKKYPSDLNELYPDYLDKVLLNPNTLGPYDYFSVSNGRSYVLCDTPEGKTYKPCLDKAVTPTPTQSGPTP